MTKNLNIPKAPDSIDIEEEQLKMAFIATSIEAMARTQGVSYSDPYIADEFIMENTTSQ
jgi:hypothetical protein